VQRGAISWRRWQFATRYLKGAAVRDAPPVQDGAARQQFAKAAEAILIDDPTLDLAVVRRPVLQQRLTEA